MFGELSALENILAGLHTQVSSGFFGLLFGTAAAGAAEKREAAEILRPGLARADQLGSLAAAA